MPTDRRRKFELDTSTSLIVNSTTYDGGATQMGETTMNTKGTLTAGHEDITDKDTQTTMYATGSFTPLLTSGGDPLNCKGKQVEHSLVALGLTPLGALSATKWMARQTASRMHRVHIKAYPMTSSGYDHARPAACGEDRRQRPGAQIGAGSSDREYMFITIEGRMTPSPPVCIKRPLNIPAVRSSFSTCGARRGEPGPRARLVSLLANGLAMTPQPVVTTRRMGVRPNMKGDIKFPCQLAPPSAALPPAQLQMFLTWKVLKSYPQGPVSIVL